MGLIQEIIKIREWIPHMGLLPKVITLKLFLDMVPSSYEDVIRAMRRQPIWLSRNYPRRNGTKVTLYVLISFHSRNVLCSLSRLIVRPGFRLFCARLTLHYLAVYSGFRELNQANFNNIKQVSQSYLHRPKPIAIPPIAPLFYHSIINNNDKIDEIKCEFQLNSPPNLSQSDL